MKNPFKIGDTKTYQTTVSEDKLAVFDAGMVHPLYSTFALAKDAEWVSRLFVLEMLEEGEEGIGSYVTVNHVSPALLNAKITLIAKLTAVVNNVIECEYQAFCHQRLLAEGHTTQKILVKAKFYDYLKRLENQ